MDEKIKIKDEVKVPKEDKVELYHILPSKPNYGSEYYFQRYLGSKANISEQTTYFIKYPYHFKSHPIYSFELAINYYLVNILYKNKIKTSYYSRDIQYWINCTLRDGIINQFITDIKNMALEKYIKQIQVSRDKPNKTKIIKYEWVIRNSIDLVVAWLEDLNLQTHYYLYQSPKLDTFLENYILKEDGSDKDLYRQDLCLCKYCLGFFETKDTSKITIPVDQLHTYDKVNIKIKDAKDNDISRVKGCRSKYKNVFRNPMSQDLSIAKEKLKILYVSLFDKENLDKYINDSNDSLEDKSNSRFFESEKKVLAEYSKELERYKKTSYVNQCFFVDVKKIVNEIADKFSNKVCNSNLFSNKHYDIYFDREKHCMEQVPIPNKYIELINNNTRHEKFKNGGGQGLVNVLALERELPRFGPFEIYDLIELNRKNEKCSWYNS